MENIKWQLPVRERLIVGRPPWVHQLAKPHCFVNDSSLCGKYYQDTEFYETDYDIQEIIANPKKACKKCYEKWKRLRLEQ